MRSGSQISATVTYTEAEFILECHGTMTLFTSGARIYKNDRDERVTILYSVSKSGRW